MPRLSTKRRRGGRAGEIGKSAGNPTEAEVATAEMESAATQYAVLGFVVCLALGYTLEDADFLLQGQTLPVNGADVGFACVKRTQKEQRETSGWNASVSRRSSRSANQTLLSKESRRQNIDASGKIKRNVTERKESCSKPKTNSSARFRQWQTIFRQGTQWDWDDERLSVGKDIKGSTPSPASETVVELPNCTGVHGK